MHTECDTCFYVPGLGYSLPIQLFTGHGQVGLKVASSLLYLKSTEETEWPLLNLNCSDASQWSRKTVPNCHRAFSYISLAINTGQMAQVPKKTVTWKVNNKTSNNGEPWYSSLATDAHSCSAAAFSSPLKCTRPERDS